MAELLWWHRVGAKVVCVDDSPTPNPGHPPLVARGIYTVAEVNQPVHANGTVMPTCLGLEEHPIRNAAKLTYWLWEASRFRPVRETSIESFRSLLNPPPDASCDDLVEEGAHA